MLPPQRTVIILVQLEAHELSVAQVGAEDLITTQWINELDEGDAIIAGSELLSANGYTDAVCW
jgi:hypothetical protein